MRICSDQTKLDIERADQKSIHVILRRPPSWKPDGSKGQTPPFPGGDPWRGIVKVINANIEEKMEKKRRAEVFDKSFLVDLGPREDETSCRVLNYLVIVFMDRLQHSRPHDIHAMFNSCSLHSGDFYNQCLLYEQQRNLTNWNRATCPNMAIKYRIKQRFVAHSFIHSFTTQFKRIPSFWSCVNVSLIWILISTSFWSQTIFLQRFLPLFPLSLLLKR